MTTTANRVHELKTHPPYFAAVLDGRKNFEVRLNDRDYGTGDVLVLREWDPYHQYTGRQVTRTVTYVLRNAERFGVQPDHVVLGLADHTPERIEAVARWAHSLVVSPRSHAGWVWDRKPQDERDAWRQAVRQHLGLTNDTENPNA